MKRDPDFLVYGSTALLVALVAHLVWPPSPHPAPGPPARVSLLGTSLATASRDEVTLVEALAESSSNGELEVHDASIPGGQLADLFAAAVRREAAGTELNLYEVNFFSFNERRHLMVPRPDKRVCRQVENVPLLYRVVAPRLAYELFQQDGVEQVLAQAVRSRFGPADRGRAVRERVAERVESWIAAQALEEEPPAARSTPRRPRPSGHVGRRRLEILHANFAHKDLDGGVDSIVLRDFLDWAARDEATATTVLYFPPLNVPLLRAAPGGRIADDVREWVDRWTSAARERGIAVLDYTELLAERGELFVDYGHLHADGLRELARAMARDLERRDL